MTGQSPGSALWPLVLLHWLTRLEGLYIWISLYAGIRGRAWLGLIGSCPLAHYPRLHGSWGCMPGESCVDTTLKDRLITKQSEPSRGPELSTDSLNIVCCHIIPQINTVHVPSSPHDVNSRNLTASFPQVNAEHVPSYPHYLKWNTTHQNRHSSIAPWSRSDVYVPCHLRVGHYNLALVNVVQVFPLLLLHSTHQ